MKKIIMYSLFTLSPSFLVLSQGSWTPRDTMPASGRDGAVGFSIGNYGYMGLGGYNSIIDTNYLDFWRFDPSNDSWTRMADFPDSETFLPAYFVIGNYGYVVTGQGNRRTGWTNRCWQYNAITNTWTEKAHFPGVGRDGAIGFSIGTKGYVGMGSSNYGFSDYKDIWSYDTTSNTWTQIADFGSLPRVCSSSFSVEGKGYVCFGEDSTFKFHNDIWVYDTGANTWTQESDCLGIIRYGANGFVIGNQIFIGTGQDSTASCDSDFYQYNTANNTWETVARFPGKIRPARFGCSGFSIGDTGYLGLGAFLGQGMNPSYFFNDLYRFVPDSITGTHNLSIQYELYIYPNPTNKKLNLQFNKQINGLATLLIMDITGREVLSCEKNINSDIMQVDVSFLSPAMYFISIKNKGISMTQKFIKQKF